MTSNTVYSTEFGCIIYIYIYTSEPYLLSVKSCVTLYYRFYRYIVWPYTLVMFGDSVYA